MPICYSAQKIVNITPIEVEKELKKEEKYTNSLKVVV